MWRRWFNWLRQPGRGSRRFGNRGERAAARHVKRQGMRILARQHRSRLGEIDLIALDHNTVVFIEVKTRQSNRAGRPVEAVGRDKQRQLTRLAIEYLKRRGWIGKRPARFDVVSVTWPEGERQPEFVHYRNAFEPTGLDGMFS